MTTKKFIIWCLSVLVLAALMAPSLAAQTSTTGDLTGTVTDPSGAVVSGATVTLKSDATGATRTTTSNSSGNYRFSLLQPGAYTITVTASGFSKVESPANVNVGQANIADVKMAVGTSTQTVEVTTAAPLIQTENADLSTNFSNTLINSLPTPGNDTTSYAYTAPGTVMNTGAGYGNFSSFGLPSTANLFTTNGNDNMDPYLNLNNSGASNLALGANELQQIAVVNNGYTAEYGRQAGTQMNAITKSGTNQYHGNAVYWWNGRVMNANDWFGNNTQTPRPFANNNQYAASFGGPIKKDKLFFFADFEGLRYVLPGAGGAIYIPTTDYTNYALSVIPAAQQAFYQKMFNLYAGAPGASRATPVTSAVDPNLGCGDLTGSAGALGVTVPCAKTFRSTQNNLNTEWLLSGRVDWNISDKDHANIRFRTDHGIQATGTDPINPAFNANSIQPEYEGQINETHVFSNSMVNNFILSGMWYKALFGPANFQQAIATFPTEVDFADGLFTSMGGTDFSFPQGRIVTQYMITDDLSKVVGNHNFKFGVNFRRNLVSDYSNASGVSGAYTVGSMTDFTTGVFNPIDFDNYVQRVPVVGAVQVKLYNLGLFAQDQWKVNSKLSLTLALRVDNTGNPGCKPSCYNRLVAPFDQLAHDPNVPYNSIIKTYGQAFQNIQSLAWGPRIGVAYSPNSNTVFRGGFGIFTDMFPGTVVDRFLGNAPNVYTASATNIGPFAFGVPGNGQDQALTSAAVFQSGFASGATLAQLQSLLPGFSAPAYSNQAVSEIYMPQFMEWNFQIEQQLSNQYSVALNYVGNHGYNIMTVNPFSNAFCRNCNAAGLFGTAKQGFVTDTAPDERFAQVNTLGNAGWANANSLTATFKMRLGSQFQANFNYTWAHALDTCSNNCLLPFTANTVVSLRYLTSPLAAGAYGNADYDVRNNFNANYVWNTKSNYNNKPMNWFLGNWTIAGTIFYHSAYPWTPVSTAVRSSLGNVTGLRNGTPMGDFLGGPIGNCTNPLTVQGGSPCIDTTNFLDPSLQTDFGNIARNSFRGSGYFDTDFNVTKSFNVTERMKFSVGANIFNLFNHANFDLPNNNIPQTGLFGYTTTTVSPATTPYGAFTGVTLSGRIVQMTGRLTF